MDKKTYQDILEANIKLHRIEGAYYEDIHPELFNWFEQGHILGDLKLLKGNIGQEARALDLGCGTGCLSLKLLRLGFKVVGVDLSQDLLGILNKKAPPQFSDKLTLVCANAEDFILGCKEKFDLIAMSSVLHHLPNYLGLLEKILSLLKPGGWLYITHEPTKYALDEDRFLRKILWQLDYIAYSLLKIGRLPKVEARSYKMSDYNLYHGFDEEQVLNFLKGAGLGINKFYYYGSVMRLGISCWIDSKLLGTKSQFSLIAKKD